MGEDKYFLNVHHSGKFALVDGKSTYEGGTVEKFSISSSMINYQFLLEHGEAGVKKPAISLGGRFKKFHSMYYKTPSMDETTNSSLDAYIILTCGSRDKDMLKCCMYWGGIDVYFDSIDDSVYELHRQSSSCSQPSAFTDSENDDEVLKARVVLDEHNLKYGEDIDTDDSDVEQPGDSDEEFFEPLPGGEDVQQLSGMGSPQPLAILEGVPHCNLNDDKSESDASSYFDSSDYGEFTDDEGEDPETRDEAVRRKSRFPAYKPVKGKIPVFQLGMIFKDSKEFKAAVTEYAILMKKDIKVKKNEPRRVLAKCFGSRMCGWKIMASWNSRDKTFQVKTFLNAHTKCGEKFYIKRLNSNVIAEKFKEVILAHPDIKTKYLQSLVRDRLSLNVTFNQCRRAKRLVLSILIGNCKAEYAKLWDYAAELRRSNPGSTINLMPERLEPGGPIYFHSMYIFFAAMKHGLLNGCRPILGIDGCFLKGFAKGELLTAIARDGNNQMFPVAWAVVPVESKESWTWFLQLLARDIGTDDGKGWTIISDRQKGLLPAMHATLSRAEHRYCCRHLFANMQRRYKGSEIRYLFWACAKSNNVPAFERLMTEIRVYDATAATEMCEVDPKHWCRAFFETFSKCENVDNNLCEAFNGTIVEARTKAVITMLDEIRLANMNRMRIKKAAATRWASNIGPLIMEKLEKNIGASGVWRVHWNGEGGYEIRSGEEQYVVRLVDKQCACGSWQLSGIPCAHAIAAIFNKGDDPEEYVYDCYSKENYLKTYEMPMQPINGEALWPKTGEPPINPPLLRKMPRRPRKNRTREEGEASKGSSHKLTRIGRVMRCKICKSVSHNRATCPHKPTNGSMQSPNASVNSTRVPTACPASTRSGSRRSGKEKVTNACTGSDKEKVTNAGTGSRKEKVANAGTECGKEKEILNTKRRKKNAASTSVDVFSTPLPKLRPRNKSGMVGFGVFFDSQNGSTVLNPGTASAVVLDKGSHVKSRKTRSSCK